MSGRAQSPPIIKMSREGRRSFDDFKQLNLSVNSSKQKNPFIEFYEVKENTLRKIGGNSLWHILKANEALPSTGKYTISFKIMKSEANCIEFGILPQDYIPI